MELKAYTLKDLGSHVQPLFSGDNKVVPFSPLRLNSYLNNPRAELSDHVLFEARVRGKLVAYRTLLPDLFYGANVQPEKFAWLSGNYVDPAFRRQGISTRLLQLAEECWDNKLMYTNYAPASKAVYDRTGSFRIIARREGKRFYLRSSTKELLGKRMGFKPVLGMADRLVNGLREKQLHRFQPVSEQQCLTERIIALDREAKQMIQKQQSHSLFRRDAEMFSWILEYPWLTDKETGPLNYHFSYTSPGFENILVRLKDRDSGSSALLWMMLNGSRFSLPYNFSAHESLYPHMARILIHTMISTGAAFLTLRDPLLVKALLAHRKIFIAIRDMPQLIFAHEGVADLIPDRPVIRDGDGDVVFT